MMQKPTKRYIPRAPRNHGLFGPKYVKNHMFLTNKWPATALPGQYKCMVNLLGKHLEFLKYERGAQKRRQTKSLRKLKVECKDGRIKLKQSVFGDTQRIKNLLQDHKEMQRLYMMMPSYLVVQNINQKTFVRRKERDRIRYRRDQLTKKYQCRLLELSNLQDKVKFQNEFTLAEETAAKKCRKDLVNSVTRLQAIRTISRAYLKIIQTLRQDAIYYDPVLDSLHKDIEEQSNFISQVISLGLPAMGRLKELSNEYQALEEKTRKNLQAKLAFLSAQRKKLKEDEDEIRNSVRKADDFYVEPTRYNRETESMLDLKSQLEDIEKIIKQVKNATLCSRAKLIYPVMKKQVEDNDLLEKELSVQEKRRDLLNNKEERAGTMRSLLENNLTEDDIERKRLIQDLRESIVAQRKNQKEIDDYTKQRGEIFVNLRFSIDQVLDTLRHVGKSIHGVFRIYPDPDLKLPLLNFENRQIRSLPPDPYEENIDKLVQTATTKIAELMNAFREEKGEAELEQNKDEYHKAYLQSLIKDDELAEKESDHAPLLEGLYSDRADASVPNRKQIKAQSAKIVEEFSKRDDD